MDTESADRLIPRGFYLDAMPGSRALRDRSWMPAALLVSMYLVLLAGAPGALRLAYPAAALLAGLYLYIKSPSQYLTFTLWIYFLTPFARRLADYRIGQYIDGNTMLLAPALVSLVALLALARIPRRIDDCWLVFVLLLGTVVYGGALGFAVLLDHQAVLKSLVAWMSPMAPPSFISTGGRSRHSNRRSIGLRSVVSWSLAFMVCFSSYLRLPGTPCGCRLWNMTRRAVLASMVYPNRLRCAPSAL
jgi:hypothetical protein